MSKLPATYWITIRFAIVGGRHVATIPGLSEGTGHTRGDAIDALATSLSRQLVSVDFGMGKLCLKR